MNEWLSMAKDIFRKDKGGCCHFCTHKYSLVGGVDEWMEVASGVCGRKEWILDECGRVEGNRCEETLVLCRLSTLFWL